MMEGEINNFVMVWTVGTASLCYCHTVGKLVTKGGTHRLIALCPAILLLFLLPLMSLTSIHLGGPTAFLLTWLSTFKLLLFAFNKGPLSSNPPLPLLLFLPLASLPIKLRRNKNKPNNKNIIWRRIRYAAMAILFVSCLPLYEFKESFHPAFTLFLYSVHMYSAMEILFGLLSAAARRFLVSVELEPQFEEPYLSTSLQDFWGRRWNIAVNRVLHPTVYVPVVRASSLVVGRKWAPIPAIVATFAVSGLMHELIFYCFKREQPTWERWDPSWDSMCFFLLHGVCLAIEIALKKALGRKWRLPNAVSLPLTVTFVMSTGLWLFVPALVRTGAFVKAKRESLAFLHFLHNSYHLLRFASFQEAVIS